MVSKFIIDEQTVGDIADGVRWRTGKVDKMQIAQMVEKLKQDYFINRDHAIEVIPADEQWARPDGWPDLDSLNLEMSGDDYIYMTYDAEQSKGASAIAWHIETADRKPATLEVGHIEDGTYIADETYTVNHNTNFARWTDDLNGYLVIRITGQIAACYGYNVSRNGQIQMFRQQPILERIAWVPHLIRFCTSYSANAWTMYTIEREKIANGDGTALLTMYYAYAYGYALQDLDITGLRTPNNTSLDNVFYGCYKQTRFDLRHFAVHRVASFNACFAQCRGLITVNLTGWNTERATTLSSMFNGCSSLKNIDGLDGFTTSNVTNFSYMFSDCHSLMDLSPVEGFDMSRATNIGYMFSACYNVRSLDLHGWVVNNVTSVAALFSNCRSLKSLNLNGWQTGTLTNIGSLFYHCESLQEIDVSWLHVTNACTNIYAAFSTCYCVKELNIPDDWDLSGISNGNSTANSLFASCYSLEKITGIKDWQFSFTNSLASMFSSCYSLKELDVSGWKVDTVTSIASMFQNCYCLENLDLSGWQPENSTSFANTFAGCWSLKSIGDISGWNVSKSTSFTSMFSDCYSLPELPNMDNWDVSKATTVASMFSYMNALKEVEINNWNLAECTTITTMFQYCRSLRKLTLRGWQIPKVTSTAPAGIFYYCYSLRDVIIELPIKLNYSFRDCFSLTHDSLINILNNLPTVTTTRTLNLTSQNINRLTAEEKQIATSKGWTLTN